MAKHPEGSKQSYVPQTGSVDNSSREWYPPDAREPSWQPQSEIVAMGPFYKINTCPMCIEMAKLNQAPVSTFCEHTPEQLRKYQEKQVQTSASNEVQADRTVRKTCEGIGCTVMGGTKKKVAKIKTPQI